MERQNQKFKSVRKGNKTFSRCDKCYLRVAMADVSHSAKRVNGREEEINAAWQGVVSYGAFSISLHDLDYSRKKVLFESLDTSKREA
jgi:hypothetical protein